MKLFSICLLLALATGAASLTLGQQLPDPEFNTSVENPAYSRSGPRVMFDEAHHNFHTTDGRYKPFADLMTNDGYQVIRNRKPFTKQSLDSFKVLVIANALGAEEMDDEGADQSAFTEDEIKVVYDWVKGGGALLLIADHAPFGRAAAALGLVSPSSRRSSRSISARSHSPIIPAAARLSRWPSIPPFSRRLRERGRGMKPGKGKRGPPNSRASGTGRSWRWKF